MYNLIFAPDRKGFGSLVLYDEMRIISSLKCRSGSIGMDGKLKNCIPSNNYKMLSAPERPVGEEVDLMYIDTMSGWGWKWRIEGHLLIHPDGGYGAAYNNGTKGCIGIQSSNGMELYWFAMWYYNNKTAPPISLEVRT